MQWAVWFNYKNEYIRKSLAKRITYNPCASVSWGCLIINTISIYINVHPYGKRHVCEQVIRMSKARMGTEISLWLNRLTGASYDAWQISERPRCPKAISLGFEISRDVIIIRLVPSWMVFWVIRSSCGYWVNLIAQSNQDLRFRIYIEGILLKGPYPPCLRMADRALLTGYPRYNSGSTRGGWIQCPTSLPQCTTMQSVGLIFSL